MSYKGLGQLNELQERKSEGSGGNVRWVKFEDGKAVKVRFANETTDESSGYDPERGLVLLVKEHVKPGPNNFSIRAECTMDDEGKCFACELHKRDFKAKWGSKLRFYTNVLIDDGKDPHIAVWGMGTFKSNTFSTIRDYAEEYGTLTQNVWKVKRSGESTETTYSLLPGPTDTEPFDWSPYTLFDLDLAINKVPYDQQEAYYTGNNTGTAADIASTDSGEW
jgi:hypothetical protein